MISEFNPSGKEYQNKGNNLVSISGKLPYYMELQTGKVLDIFCHLYKDHLPPERKTARTKINGWLYNRTRPGFYFELANDLHLAYGHQKDGLGTQHYWRLFFNNTFKGQIESIINCSALVIGTKNKEESHSSKTYTEGLKEWGGMYFRSESEIRVAEELDKQGLMFFANLRGRVNNVTAPLSKNQSTGRLELDFLVFKNGQCLSLEVDGSHHEKSDQKLRDYARDRLLLKEQINTVRFTANECYEYPELVVQEIISFFK
jgi:very-short-patch-repair endonuclease